MSESSTSLAPDPNKSKGFPVVAIGASAGGLEAVKELFENLADDTGLGYVYIQHLDPTHQSMLSTILSRVTRMKVMEAEDKLTMERNHVYIIPPNKNMAVVDGIIVLDPRPPKPHINMPIDKFFISLAEKHKEGSIGIVLSGNANDGTAGLKAIKTAGGITFAQDESAQFESMPKSAIGEGVVDLVLSPKEIAKELERISKQPEVVAQEVIAEHDISDTDENLVSIIQLLKKSVGVDFAHYKPNTIKRRIIRRMILYKLEKLSDYFQYLKRHTSEITVLYHDLLIHVTSFFRDPDTMEFMKKTILPAILKTKSANTPIRIWVPACSTGEEAYSLAILLCELKDEQNEMAPIQIFATDLSELAIARARLGIFTAGDLADLSETRLNKYFVKIDGSYRINKTIRDMCVFAPHNIFKDPPFSRLDLISCCNLFIYLDVVLQKKIIGTFYYSLAPDGYLVLGKSETTSSSGQLFTQVEKKFKVYSKKHDASVKAIFDMNYRLPIVEKSDRIEVKKWTTPKAEISEMEKVVDDILIAKYIPASVVINEDMEILQFRGSTGLFLEPSPGKASFSLMKMARKELAFELKNIIHKSTRTGNVEKKSGLEIKIKEQDYYVAIEVTPLKSSNEEKLFLVVFEEMPMSLSNDPKIVFSKDEAVKSLMDELHIVREDMRSIIEDQEAGKEELQSANEEIISSNEELQSINEELETSKEEVESSNEELLTINSELQLRNDQLTEAQEYAEAIFETILEAVLVINRDMSVKMANKAFYKIFKVKQEDTEGKILYELGNRQWDAPKLRQLVNKILVEGTQFNGLEIEHDFPVIGKKIMQVNGRKIIQKMPHQELVLLAMEDVTEQRLAQKLMAQREAWFKNIADNAPVLIWMSGTDRTRNFFNSTWLNFTGRNKEQELLNGWLDGIYYKDSDSYLQKYNEAFNEKTLYQAEYRLRRNDGSYRWVTEIGKPFFSADEKFTGYIGSLAEIHDKKVIQEDLENKVQMRTKDLEELNKELKRSNNELQQFAYVASHDLQEPLRKIMTFSDKLMSRKDHLGDNDKKYIEKISGSVQRMAGLIDDLLNYSKAARTDQKFSEIILNDLVHNVLTDFDLIISEQNATVKVDLTHTIYGIPIQMKQLFHNLVSNALKFTKDGVRPEIIITSHYMPQGEVLYKAGLNPDKRYIKITVKDNGIGFSNKYAEQIFVIFQRLNEFNVYPGNGIGLSLCKKIVDNHGGKIYANSLDNEGATFTILFPEKPGYDIPVAAMQDRTD